MAEDLLIRLHANGYHVQRLIDSQYQDARNDPGTWAAQRNALIARWRGMAGEWAGQVEIALAGDGTDLTAVSRFHDAPQSSAAPHGASEEWAWIRGFLVARLAVLGQIIEARRQRAAAPIVVGGSVGVINQAPVFGDVHGSVTHLQQSGHAELAQLLRQVIDKLPTSRLSEPERDDGAQFAKTLAEEAAKPGKLSRAGWAAARALGRILTRSAELAQLWQGIDALLKL